VNEKICSTGMARARSASPRRVVFSANLKRFQELGPVLDIAEAHVLEFGTLKRTKRRRRRKRRDFRPGRALRSQERSSLSSFFLYSCILGLEEGNGWMKEVLLYLLILQERFAFSIVSGLLLPPRIRDKYDGPACLSSAGGRRFFKGNFDVCV
jgi:hypothetical protein